MTVDIENTSNINNDLSTKQPHEHDKEINNKGKLHRDFFFMISLCLLLSISSSLGSPRPMIPISAADDSVQALYIMGAGGMKCCWRKQILKEAMQKSRRLYVTDDPDSEGSHWLVALNRLVREEGPECLLNAVKKSLERRNGTKSWRIYLLDWSDRGIDMPGMFEEEHFRSLSDLIGKENIYFAQRASISGRKNNQYYWWSIFWHRLGKEKKLRKYCEILTLPVGHLDYTVRSDLLNKIDTLVQEGVSSALDKDFPIGRSKKLHSSTNHDHIDIYREKHAVHFWNEIDAKEDNVMLRNEVSRSLKSLQWKNLEFIVNTNEAGERGADGRNSAQIDYAKAMLEYQIIVVCQRDSHETHYRLMEALSSGAMVMTDHTHYLPKGIEDGKSIIVYKNASDLQEKVLYYLRHDKERKEIAREGRAAALDHNRSWQWLERLIFTDQE